MKTGRIRPVAVKKSVSNLRKFKSVSDTKLSELKTRWLKKRTYNKMKWGVRAYNSWRDAKLVESGDSDDMLKKADLNNLAELTKESVIYGLCRFVPEVTKLRDGSDYPGKTLYEMVVSIQKFLNQNDVPWKLIEDPKFIDVRTVLDNTMKERVLNNVGLVKKQAQMITIEHENYLWETGVLGEDTPDKLRSTVLFLLGINLALRAGDEHYDLRRYTNEKPSQIAFERYGNSGKRCLVYREDTVTKTNDGGISNIKKDRKVVWVFPSENVNRCPVRLVDKYMSLCPDGGKNKKANFYLRSLEKTNPAQWYSVQPIGKNTLNKVVKNLLKSANLDGYFTNHSLRRTSATRMFQAGIDGKIVREVIGHVSDAINKYQETSAVQRQEVSKVLNDGKNGSKSEESKQKTDMKPPKSPTPSLEISVMDHSEKAMGYNCSCKRKKFELDEGNQLSSIIADIVSKRKSGKAKIKLEIEFSD